MNAKKKIKALELVADLRSGMSETDLMEKYEISEELLQATVRRLIGAEIVDPNEIDDKWNQPLTETQIQEQRRMPRCYPVVSIPIFDLDDMTTELYVRDINERGIQLVGLKAEVDDVKTFVVQVEGFRDVHPFSFEAQCRWTVPSEEDGKCTAGFEITDISITDLVSLQELIRSGTFSD